MMIYRFADLQFDTGRRLLTRNGRRINLTKLCFDVLKVLVEAAPDLVSHDELIDRVWGPDRVITPENLAQRIHLLRESIGDEAADPSYIEGVRGQGFRLIPLVEVDTSRLLTAPPPKRRYWLPALIGIAAVGILIAWATSQRNEVPLPQIDQKSVAVLPFKNIGGNPDNEYLSDGITETILNALAQLPGLKVTARTSSFYFRGQEIDVREIAAHLGVAHLLEGSVQVVGDKHRIVVQLIEAETGFHLWSETYDPEMGDIFAVQKNIATSVADAMQVTLVGSKIPIMGTKDAEAYDLYLQGIEQKNKHSYRGLSFAEISFKEALARDPEFFESSLELALTYLNQARLGKITSADASEILKPLVGQLHEEKPDNALVLIPAIALQRLRARTQGDGPFDTGKHLALLTAAVEKMPNEPRLYVAISDILADANRLGESLEWLDRGITVDPLSWRMYIDRGDILYRSSDLDGAEAAYARALELNPDNPGVLSASNEIDWQRKHYAKWFAITKKAMELDPLDVEFPSAFSIFLSDFGLFHEADKYLERAIAIDPDHAYVHRAKLARLLLHDNDNVHDHARARDMSEALLRADIDDRWGTYWWVAMVFVSTTTELSGSDAALAVLEELQPRVTLPNFEPQNDKQQVLQYSAVLAMAQSQSGVQKQNLLDAVVPYWDKYFPSWQQFKWRLAPIQMARGDKKAAVELALKNLGHGLSVHEADDVARYRHLYLWKDLAQDRAVAERLAELDAEKKKAGEEIWDYIVENDLQLD